MMAERENQTKKHSLRFTGDDIVLTITLMEKLKNAIDIVYYLMDHQDEDEFVLLLMNAENVELEILLEEAKRDSDILFEIDKEKSIYAMLCQDTKVDGGYRFAERIIRNIVSKDGTDIYCAELEVRSTSYNLKDVILKLVETFIKAKQDGKSGEIIYKSLN
jgi:hypothetical protein